MKIKKLLFLVGTLFIFACTNPPTSQTNDTQQNLPTTDTVAYKLVWSEEFDYTGLPDTTKWSYDIGKGANNDGWGNWELQYYTDKRKENAWVENGVLTITAIKEKYKKSDFTSARLVTRQKGDWLYGRFEIRALISDGVGLWSAIWMLPTDWEYGAWPKSGEIDIMENVGFDPDTIVATAHTEKQNGMLKTQISGKIGVPDCNENFHVYALEWEENEYRIYVDSTLYYTHKNDGGGYANWPFDKRFHLILNLAVGGGWGGEKGVDKSIFPRKMQVDYVKVYQK